MLTYLPVSAITMKFICLIFVAMIFLGGCASQKKAELNLSGYNKTEQKIDSEKTVNNTFSVNTSVNNSDISDQSVPQIQKNNTKPLTTNITYDDKFITYNPVNLSQFSRISKFRSCAGHDYSGYDADGILELNRSMKHYFEISGSFAGSVNVIEVRAPFDGKIYNTMPELVGNDTQVWLIADKGGDWLFVFFHITLLPTMNVGSNFKAGDLIAYVNPPAQKYTSFDITLKKRGDIERLINNYAKMQENGTMNYEDFNMGNYSGRNIDEYIKMQKNGSFNTSKYKQTLDSVFYHMTENVTSAYSAKGINLNNIIVSRQERDSNPCPCPEMAYGECRYQDDPNGWVGLTQ